MVDSGLVYRGDPFEGVYAGAFEGDELRGVAAHYWNGNLVLQAPQDAAQLAQAALRYSERKLEGILGPWPQVCAARDALGAHGFPTRMDSEEILYSLDLTALRVPAPLEEGRFVCRRGTEEDFPRLVELSIRETQEVFGDADTPEQRRRTQEALDRWQTNRVLFVLEENGTIVATSLFHGHVRGAVQVGGVYTDPQHRGKGAARCVVAGSLLLARSEGMTTASLFTGVENSAAQRAYESIGFLRAGDYGIVLFKEPVHCSPSSHSSPSK